MMRVQFFSSRAHSPRPEKEVMPITRLAHLSQNLAGRPYFDLLIEAQSRSRLKKLKCHIFSAMFANIFSGFDKPINGGMAKW